MAEGESTASYPDGLLDWAGHRKGGVRRLFYSANGRPSGEVIRTSLLGRLERWAQSLATGIAKSPNVVLLAGGPGNGKTEAVEFTIYEIDKALGLSGRLVKALQDKFLGRDGQPAPRLARVDLASLSDGRFAYELAIVQDASASDANSSADSPALLLVADLARLLEEGDKTIYLACVNRGVLDDALISATESKRLPVQRLLETIVRSVGMAPDAPACWPLDNYPSVVVWPMDVETLIGDGAIGPEQTPPAEQLLAIATSAGKWPTGGACIAGERCPFCTSRVLLSGEPHRSSLLRILRWYELASGKRWSFRDLSSLVSYLLAGIPPDDSSGASYAPCNWASQLLQLQAKPSGKDSLRLSAPYLLVASQYQHALFGRWPKAGIRSFRLDLNELQLQENPTLMGLYHFLNRTRGQSIPPTLESQLAGVAEILDPAVADSELDVEISSKTTIKFRDIDTRFSNSVGEGLQFIQKYRCLTSLEVDLLKRLDQADQRLSDSDLVRRRPAVALRVQALVRDFACRLVRRSIGVRAAIVRDAEILSGFQSVVRGDTQLLHEAVKQIEGLLNEKEKFVITLNTTFGEPLPPAQRRAVLTTIKQKVKAREFASGDRPVGAVRFLSVGTGSKGQSIPLTYELFRSVRELRKGMIPASLPRPVVALLDTTRARLAGQIVRDEDMLDGGEIRIGLRRDVIVRELGAFLVRQEDGE